ncbi:MAG: NADH-quinone oxidoreductase subunit L [Myxococcota bacterium]
MESLRTPFPADDFALLALVLLAPLVGALVNGVFGRRLGKEAVRTMALAVMAVAFALSILTFINVATMPAGADAPAPRLYWRAWEWFSLTPKYQSLAIDAAFSVDALSATMMVIITGIGFFIHLYSSSYMAGDPGFYRFFAYLNLFVFAMLVLVLGDNMVVMFVGWEGVGLCSYLLIGFWFDDAAKASAGKKAFITNRIGDFGLLVAMAILLFHTGGDLGWTGLEDRAASLTKQVTVWPPNESFLRALPGGGSFLAPEAPIRASVATLAGVFLFLGCAGKSAQIPLYVWLPDAMAGPTPVSALIHAATMVTAGVYLVARMSFLFVLSPAAMALIATTGAVTALLAASIAFAQTDLKRVLAYSTVSQLGFMFVGVGVGAFGPGFFHVVTHAFFKGCLFLGAGSVIHAMHATIHDEAGSQDMRAMGGLRKYMPVTHATFLVSCLAIAGAPGLSGFWSKDELMYKAYTLQVVPSTETLWVPPVWFGTAIYAACAVAALGTAFYMFRAYFLTFWGEFRGWTIVSVRADGHGDDATGHDLPPSDDATVLRGPAPHESPWPMTVPLVVLAVFAAFGGFLYAEPIHIAPLGHFLAPVFASAEPHVRNLDPDHASMLPLLAVGVAIFFVGAGGAYYVYVARGGAPAAAFVRAAPRLHGIVAAKWKVDELYDATVVGLVDAMGETAAQFDRWVIDGILARLTAGVVTVSGIVLRALQTGRVQLYAAGMVLGAAALGWFLFTPHAETSADTATFRTTGALTLNAAPGHGYAYHWAVGKEAPGPEREEDFRAEAAAFELTFRECETKTVHLAVRNVFGRTSRSSSTYCREIRQGCCQPEGSLPPLPPREAIPQFPGLDGPTGAIPGAASAPASAPASPRPRRALPRPAPRNDARAPGGRPR